MERKRSLLQKKEQRKKIIHRVKGGSPKDNLKRFQTQLYLLSRFHSGDIYKTKHVL